MGRNLSPASLASMIAVLAAFCLYWNLLSFNVLLESTGGLEDAGVGIQPQAILSGSEISSSTRSLSSSCGFQMFPYTNSQSRLPWVFDVFASHDAKHVTFVAIQRGFIDPQFQEHDNFAGNYTTGIQHRFLCNFQGNEPVLSEPVHPPGYGMMNGREQEWTYLIRCKIPEKYRPLIVPGQVETNLHVDLHAAQQEMKEAADIDVASWIARNGMPSTKLSNLRICHPAPLQPKQFRLMAHTRVRSSYSYHPNGKPISENYRIIDWIDYHKFRGFDHFVIYDNDPFDHGPLASLLQPHVDLGLVTRVWNPMNESYRVLKVRDQTCHIQGATGVAALHRFGFATEYFASMDVDEFFIPARARMNLYEFTRGLFLWNRSLDVIKWRPRIMSWCNGTVYKSNHSELEKKCRTQYHRSGPKMIFPADRIWLYHTHNSFLTSNWTKPEEKSLHEFKDGFLGHFRRDVNGIKKRYQEGETILTQWVARKEKALTLDEYWMYKRGVTAPRRTIKGEKQ